jgi:hypothetical protein
MKNLALLSTASFLAAFSLSLNTTTFKPSIAPAYAVGTPSGGNQCRDGIDNDGDGLIDWGADLGCWSHLDGNESAGPRSLENGFTTFNKSADTRVVYVSSMLGNDIFNGLCPTRPLNAIAGACGPKKTLQAGYDQLRNGHPDWLLLRRGNVWKDEFFPNWDKSGRSPAQKMLLGSYGTSTQRPVIMTGNNTGLYATDIQNFAIVGIEFSDPRRDPLSPQFRREGVLAGSPPAIRMLYGIRNVLVEDMKISNHSMTFEGSNATNNNENATYYNGQKVVNRWFNIADIEIRRNVFDRSYATGNHVQGIFTYGGANRCQTENGVPLEGDICLVPGGPNIGGALLIEENVFYRNGWYDPTHVAGSPTRQQLGGDGGVDTIYNRSMYLSGGHGNTTVRGNIDYNGSSGGIQLRMGGLVERNLILDAPIGITVGHAQNSPGFVATGVIRDNVLLGSRNITGEPRGYGIGVGGTTSGVAIYSNIIAHATNSTGGIQAIFLGGLSGNNVAESVVDTLVEGNVVYKWSRPNIGGSAFVSGLTANSTSLGNMVRNNVFQQPVLGTVVDIVNPSALPGISFENNRHYSANSLAFRVASNGLNFSNWLTAAKETGSAFAQAAMPDPDRTLEGYAQLQLGVASKEAFMQEALKQSRYNWRPQFTADAVGDYIRTGMGMPTVRGRTVNTVSGSVVNQVATLPTYSGVGVASDETVTTNPVQALQANPAGPVSPANLSAAVNNVSGDHNRDGVVNKTDTALFLADFRKGDLAADKNGDGKLSQQDVVRFQQQVAKGAKR